MTTPGNEKEQSSEERIGNLIGTILCLLLLAFFIWGYWPTVAAQLGLIR